MAHFRREADAAFHEEVAREHVDRGMPIVELHRNRGVPLASVRRWIGLYRGGGRSALDEAAAVIAARNRKPATKAQLARLRPASHPATRIRCAPR
jgi:transposase-like protein